MSKYIMHYFPSIRPCFKICTKYYSYFSLILWIPYCLRTMRFVENQHLILNLYSKKAKNIRFMKMFIFKI